MKRMMPVGRIFYLTGPADIAADYLAWRNPQASISSFGGGVFIEQFFQLCENLGSEVKLVSTASGTNARHGRFDLEYRELKTNGLSGLSYHLRMLKFMIGIVVSIVRFRPNVVILAIAEPYWFVLYVLMFSKIVFVPFFHCTLWPRLKKFDELSLPQRILLLLSGSFIRFRCRSVLAITQALDAQLATVTGNANLSIQRFRPIYDSKMFEKISPSDWNNRPFRILFAGNILRQKGVFTLVEVAERLFDRYRDQIVFDVCGSGPDLPKLSSIVAQRKLPNFFLYGPCDRKKLTELYGQSHAVIVPTSRDFPEGFNRVSVEAVLSRRPVIVSSAVVEQALSAATIVVEPSDVDSFVSSIAKLYEDEIAYKAMCQRAEDVRLMLFDDTFRWEAGIKRILGLDFAGHE